MTQRIPTVTEHLQEAQAILDHVALSPPEIERLRKCMERALETIQFARCEATAALDKF